MYEVLKEMARSHVSKRKRYDNEDAELLENISGHLVTKETLSEKLAQHVEQVSLLVLSRSGLDLLCFVICSCLVRRGDQSFNYAVTYFE